MTIKIPILVVLTGLWLTISGCSRHPENQAQGYIEGRYTYMASSVPGVLMQLSVQRGMHVKQGQALYVLQAQPESDAYTAATENLKQAQNARDAIAADLVYAKLTFERNKELVQKKAIQQSELDSARSRYDATVAQLAKANANIAASTALLAQAKWTKDQKVGIAPVDAIVFDTFYRIGEYTEANHAILSLLSPADIKAVFYVLEAQLGSIQLGDTISVHCNGCEKAYDGRVSFISPTAEYTPPVIYSNDTSAKLVFRVEAAFTPAVAYFLHPGQPVIVTYTHHE
jgi:HlyD family secretion protein